MRLLAFDTSTDTLSVAVAHGDGRWHYQGAGGARASNDLIATALDLLAQASLRLADVQAICFGAGPGSFTGLRTACAVAQGLAYGAGVPVLPVNSLLAVAEAASANAARRDTLALLDARMDEIYAARFAWAQDHWQTVSEPALFSPAALVAHCQALTGAQPRLAGNPFGVYPALDALTPQFDCVRALPDATALLRLAPDLLARGQALPAAQALPHYVRDKVAKTTAERAAEKAGQA